MAEKLKFTSYGNGVPIVLIHGWGLNSGVWQLLAQKLNNTYRVITIDLPGYGLNTDHSLSPYSLKEAATLIQQTISEPAVYLGWSLGGLVATQIALDTPNDVLGLVTVCNSPCFVERTSWLGIAPSILELFHRQLSEDTRKTIDGFLKIQAMGSPNIRHDIKLIRDLVMQYPMATRKTLDESLALLETTDLRTELAQLSMPFLRMYGRLDGLVPSKVIQQIDKFSPNSTEYTFNKASHAPFISHVDEFEQVLNEWLSFNLEK